ncbi:MAG TPA: flippase [Candidatus Moranbacteria bacterium]|nr:flippase [Candidatus Moranbacteria bacterium]
MSTLAKSALWVTISEIIFNLSGFVIHSVVGRILGPADYGRYGLVVTLTTMVIILIGNGIPTAMSKYISEIYDTNPRLVGVIKRQTIILQSILIGVVTIIFYFSAPLLAKILGDPTLTPLFQISTLIIPLFAAASFYFSYYTGLHKFGIQSFLKVARSLFRIIYIISFAYFFGVKGSISGYIAAPASIFLLALFIDKLKVSKELKANEIELSSSPLGRGTKGEGKNIQDASLIRPSGTFSQREKGDVVTFDWHRLTNYAWQIVIFFLAYELLISIDLYLVKGILHDDYLTGIYNASLTIGRIPYYIFYALTVILLPVISKSTAEKNSKKTSEIISQSLRLMLLLLVPMIILMSIYSRPIIKIFYSNKYIDAAYPMSILVWGVGFLTIFYVFCFVMNGAGKVKKPMILSIIGLIINTVLNYILIKKYGIAGSAVATSISSAIITFIMLYYIWKDFGVKINLTGFSKMIVAGIIMYAASMLFNRGELIFMLWSAILFSLYIVILILLGEIKKADIILVRDMLRRKKASEVEEEFSGNEPSA